MFRQPPSKTTHALFRCALAGDTEACIDARLAEKKPPASAKGKTWLALAIIAGLGPIIGSIIFFVLMIPIALLSANPPNAADFLRLIVFYPLGGMFLMFIPALLTGVIAAILIRAGRRVTLSNLGFLVLLAIGGFLSRFLIPLCTASALSACLEETRDLAPLVPSVSAVTVATAAVLRWLLARGVSFLRTTETKKDQAHVRTVLQGCVVAP